jgi:hypothetical protein
MYDISPQKVKAIGKESLVTKKQKKKREVKNMIEKIQK